MLQATIVRGRIGTAMRPFGKGSQGVSEMSEQDIDDIVAYIRQWSTIAPSPMTIPAKKSLTEGVADTWTTNETELEHIDPKISPTQRSVKRPLRSATIAQIQGD